MAKSVKKGKSVITDASMVFLKNYINNASPVGFESSGQKLWLDYLKPYIDSHFTDPYGTAVGVINPDAPFKVVIEAHADEISWFVNYINNEGLLYLKRNGGVDHQVAPAQRVFIHGKKGPVPAVFGWPAIHTRMGNTDAKEQQPKVDNLFALSMALFAVFTMALYTAGIAAVAICILLIPGVIVGCLYSYAKRNFSDYLYYFVLDGLMMLSSLIMIIL